MRVPPVVVTVSLVVDAPSSAGLQKTGSQTPKADRVRVAPTAPPPRSKPASSPGEKEVPVNHRELTPPAGEGVPRASAGGRGRGASEGLPGQVFFGGSWVPNINQDGGNGRRDGADEGIGKGPADSPGGKGNGYADALLLIRASIENAKSYPLIAKRRGLEGTVTVEFTINGKGLPESIRIAGTSGWDILDAAARDTIYRAAPFPPLGAKIEIPITFRLKKTQ